MPLSEEEKLARRLKSLREAGVRLLEGEAEAPPMDRLRGRRQSDRDWFARENKRLLAIGARSRIDYTAGDDD